jgi:hypothetical protein
MKLVIPSEHTIIALCQLHSPLSDLVLPPIFDYQPEHTFVMDRILFAKKLAITPHLFLGGVFGVVYEHF